MGLEGLSKMQRFMAGASLENFVIDHCNGDINNINDFSLAPAMADELFLIGYDEIYGRGGARIDVRKASAGQVLSTFRHVYENEQKHMSEEGYTTGQLLASVTDLVRQTDAGNLLYTWEMLRVREVRYSTEREPVDSAISQIWERIEELKADPQHKAWTERRIGEVLPHYQMLEKKYGLTPTH